MGIYHIVKSYLRSMTRLMFVGPHDIMHWPKRLQNASRQVIMRNSAVSVVLCCLELMAGTKVNLHHILSGPSVSNYQTNTSNNFNIKEYS